MTNFELEGWEDINQSAGTIGTGINRAVHKLTVAIFNSGSKISSALERAETAINKASSSADKHANALTRATWVLAGATGVLALATVALFVVTFIRH